MHKIVTFSPTTSSAGGLQTVLSTRSILISYAGYPYAFNSLMPDNGLANLAGALLCAGHETVILDYGTVGNIRETFTRELSEMAKEAYESALRNIGKGTGLTAQDLQRFSLLDGKLTDAVKKRCLRVAEEVCEWIERLRADFVGFKLWNGDGFWGSIDIAERVKSRYKNVRIFAGGPHADIFGEHIYRATGVFDCLAHGDGEETIVQLAEFAIGRRELKDVNNVIFKDSGGHVHRTPLRRVSDLSSLPFARYDESVYPSMRGNEKIKVIVVDESRGCRFGCYFCIHPLKSGRKLRCKKPSRVVEEIKLAFEQTGTRAFRYAGSSTPPALAKGIADLIISEGLNLEYTGFGNFLDAVPEYLAALAKSGCCSLAFGMESGSPTILKDAMGKPIRRERMREVFKACKEAGIFTVVAVIFPAPLETKETEQETLSFIREVRPDSVSVLFPIIYPGTKWATEKERFRFSFDETQYIDAVMMAKAKLLFPMDFWEDLPYSLSGRSFRGILNETARLTRALEREGILTSLTDDFALMARLGGYGGQEKKLRDLGRLWFFSGQAESIQHFVDAVNASAMCPRLSDRKFEGGAEVGK